MNRPNAMHTKQSAPQDDAPSHPTDKEPRQKPKNKTIDIDDAQIEDPKDDAFKKGPMKEQPSKRCKNSGTSAFD